MQQVHLGEGRRRRSGCPAAAPSRRLDAWLPDAPFRDTIEIVSTASSSRLLRAFDEVTAGEMPLARALGTLRYLPKRWLAHGGDGHDDARAPFLSQLLAGGSVVLESSPDEVIVGTIGKLHQIVDQELVRLKDGAEFAAFDAPNHEKLAMSIRAVPVGEGASDVGGTRLVLEHRTQPTDDVARRRFARYWLAIKPSGAFVTRQLLLAVARRAEA